MAKRTVIRQTDTGDDTGTEQQPASPPAVAEFGYFTPPEGDEEFVFEDVASMPDWADKGWAGVNESSGAPVLRVPGMVYPNAQPYHTNVAEVGDTVKWDSEEQKLLIVKPKPEPQKAA